MAHYVYRESNHSFEGWVNKDLPGHKPRSPGRIRPRIWLIYLALLAGRTNASAPTWCRGGSQYGNLLNSLFLGCSLQPFQVAEFLPRNFIVEICRICSVISNRISLRS